MTVALAHVVLSAPMIAAEPDLADWHALMDMLHRRHWALMPLASTGQNLLYDLFGATVARAISTTAWCLCLMCGNRRVPLICGPGASNALSVTANASEVRFHCSRSEYLSIPHGVPIVTSDDVPIRTSFRTYAVCLCSPERETYPRAVHAGGGPWHMYHRRANRECVVDPPLLVLM